MKIAVSIGDPNGIGFEVFLKSLYKLETKENIEFNLYAPKSIISQWLKILKFNYEIDGNLIEISDYKVNIIDFDSEYKLNLGKVELEAGKIAVKSLELAVNDVINSNYDGILTLPITKEAMYITGWEYPGHTEFLADKCNSQKQLMILFKDNLRCALVTIHKPIMELPKLITKPAVLDKIKQFNSSLIKDFGIISPKIAVLGLNPHAGENGNIGTEELDIIQPAIKQAKEDGIDCYGAFPADGYFAHKEYLNYDGYLAMYHDQGLVALKFIANEGGVNFTAGLPIVRTSPDHGTAYNIAGKNIASEQSTLDSILAIIDIVNNRKKAKLN